MSAPQSPAFRADLYLKRRNLSRHGELGYGKDGHVWLTSRQSALKVHVAAPSYLAEREAYIRLLDLRVRDIAGLTIPMLRDYDDDLFAIEIDVVFPPFVVDFASSRLDAPPDLIEDEGNTFADMVRDRFGDRADDVLNFYHELAARTGIYLQDLHPHNIKFD